MNHSSKPTTVAGSSQASRRAASARRAFALSVLLLAAAAIPAVASGPDSGSLERRFRGMGDVSALHAKTGSVSHVNALSGYIGADPERRYAFSIIANHTTASSFEIRALIDKIGKALLTERAK